MKLRRMQVRAQSVQVSMLQYRKCLRSVAARPASREARKAHTCAVGEGHRVATLLPRPCSPVSTVSSIFTCAFSATRHTVRVCSASSLSRPSRCLSFVIIFLLPKRRDTVVVCVRVDRILVRFPRDARIHGIDP